MSDGLYDDYLAAVTDELETMGNEMTTNLLQAELVMSQEEANNDEVSPSYAYNDNKSSENHNRDFTRPSRIIDKQNQVVQQNEAAIGSIQSYSYSSFQQEDEQDDDEDDDELEEEELNFANEDEEEEQVEDREYSLHTLESKSGRASSSSFSNN